MYTLRNLWEEECFKDHPIKILSTVVRWILPFQKLIELNGHMGVYLEVPTCWVQDTGNCGQRTCARVWLLPQSCWSCWFTGDCLKIVHQIIRYGGTRPRCHIWLVAQLVLLLVSHLLVQLVELVVELVVVLPQVVDACGGLGDYISWLAAAPVLGSIISTNSSKSM